MNSGAKDLVIVGASGFGREVYCYIKDIPEWNFIGFIDDEIKENTIEGFKILGPISELNKMEPKPWVAVAIAEPKIRKRVVNTLRGYGVNFATIIHPSVYITPHIEVGEGTIICVGNHFTTNIKIGEFCIINCYISIGHDAIFNDFVSIMSNSAFGGDTLIGQGCYFGLSCTVINKIKIGEWSVIGAGTTVVNDIPPYSLAVGVPAKVIKTLDK